MKHAITKIIFFFCLYLALTSNHSFGQCTWSTALVDGFEYQTACPYLVPGTTIHTVPQIFSVHSGTYSLYLNFVNCTPPTGTCAGAKVFERPFVVCPNMPLRFSTWLTTSFSGNQCNVQIKISDANGTVLNNQTNIPAPYSPAWVQYQSGIVVPITDTIYFTMYTNAGGGNGNDLSMDDFLMEKCMGGENSTTSGSVCANVPSANLYNLISIVNDTTGTWSGPGPISGGYQGTFIPGVSLPGNYVYTNAPYGTGIGCPLAYDSLQVTLLPAPVVNLGNDTTICLNQSLLLNAAAGTGNTYLWNNGVTGPTVLAFTSSMVTVTNNYTVNVTNTNGCISTDSIAVTFQICSGISESSNENSFYIFPNPSSGNFQINVPAQLNATRTYKIFNSLGAIVQKGVINDATSKQLIKLDNSGVYWLQIETNNSVSALKKLVIY